MYSLLTPGDREIDLIFALRAEVSEIRADFQMSKVPEIAHIHSFQPKGSKLSLFVL